MGEKYCENHRKFPIIESTNGDTSIEKALASAYVNLISSIRPRDPHPPIHAGMAEFYCGAQTERPTKNLETMLWHLSNNFLDKESSILRNPKPVPYGRKSSLLPYMCHINSKSSNLARCRAIRVVFEILRTCLSRHTLLPRPSDWHDSSTYAVVSILFPHFSLCLSSFE